jgi:cold shock protein
MEIPEMVQGTIQWFNAAKGFGFIQADGPGAEVFMHVPRPAAGSLELAPGDRVEFDLDELARGRLRAMNVRKLDLTPPPK